MAAVDPLAALADDPALAFLASMERERKLLLERYHEHPFRFLVECVKTIDQATGAVRPFPNTPYLDLLAKEWLANRLLLIVKSRRMVVTWLMIGLHVWLALFRPMTKIAFCARKQGMNEAEGSAELVWRANFIIEHLPETVKPLHAYKFLHLSLPGVQSEIVGVGEGPDQLRQHTLTAIFADEFGFWDRPFDTYVASRPTIEGGGRFTAVTTPAPGFSKQLVFDQI